MQVKINKVSPNIQPVGYISGDGSSIIIRATDDHDFAYLIDADGIRQIDWESPSEEEQMLYPGDSFTIQF